MTLQLDSETNIQLPIDEKGIYTKVVEASLDYESCPYEIELNLILTDNEGIRNINQEHRQIDAATDVLSFPMVEYQTSSDFSALESSIEDYFHPDTGELLLGDIVISVEKVLDQAEKYNHSIEREFAFLIAHSMLHLFGYDHMTKEEAKVMEKKQEDILRSLDFNR